MVSQKIVRYSKSFFMRIGIFILVFFITEARAQKINSRIDSLFAVWDKPMVPGVAIGVIQHGEWKYKKSFGFANLNKSAPINDSTQFWIASVTKQFTALGIYQLESEGKLMLDHSIRKYIPSLPVVFEPITIYHLLHHTSGMRDGFVLTALSKKPESEYTNQTVLQFLNQQKELNADPGNYFEYNNSGYVMLAYVIEAVSGKNYKDFMTSSIFRPLNMLSTYVSGSHPSSPGMTEGYHSKDYSSARGTFVEGHFAGDTYGSTGIVTTLTDLGKWVTFLQGLNKVATLRQARIKLFEKGKLSSGQTIAYAGGLEAFSFEGIEVYEHFGADEGFKANILYFPAKKLSIIGLTNNTTNFSFSDDLYKVAKIVLDLNERIHVNTGLPGKLIREQAFFTETPFPVFRRIKIYPGSIEMSESQEGVVTKYFPESNHYKIDNPTSSIKLTVDKSGIEISDSYNCQKTKLKPILPDSTTDDLIMLAGNYKSQELETNYTIIAEKGFLLLEFVPGVRFKLTRLSKEYFVFDYVGPNYIKIGPKHFYFTRDGVHNLLFSKETD